MIKRFQTTKGFSLVELLIAMGLLAIIIWALGSLFVSTNNSYSSQKQLISVQEKARSTMELLIRLLNKGLSTSVVIGGTSPNNTLSFSSVEEEGRCYGSCDATHLKDPTKSWSGNQWKNNAASIYAGSGSGQTNKQITGNSGDTITISNTSPWSPIPNTSSDFRILANHTFTLSGNTLQYTKNGATTTLCTNVTGFTVNQVVTNGNTRLDLILTVQTANALLETGQNKTITLSSSAGLIS